MAKVLVRKDIKTFPVYTIPPRIGIVGVKEIAKGNTIVLPPQYVIMTFSQPF
jgi:hypothetical protein